MTIRVLLADDHPLVRDGLRFALERAGDMDVVGEAEDGLEALALTSRLQPDVVVLDITMPRLNGLEATRQLVRRHPGLKVLFLSLHDSPALVGEALAAGAKGYLTKASAGSHVVEAVRRVQAGGVYVCPDVTLSAEVSAGRERLSPPGRAARLTPQEHKVLQLIAEGRTARQIAEDLGRSVETVRAHRRNLMAKLGIHKQTALVRYAVRVGLTRL